MKHTLTAIGRGSTIAGLLLVLAGAKGSHLWLLLAGKVLIGLGIVLLMIHFWKQAGR